MVSFGIDKKNLKLFGCVGGKFGDLFCYKKRQTKGILKLIEEARKDTKKYIGAEYK